MLIKTSKRPKKAVFCASKCKYCLGFTLTEIILALGIFGGIFTCILTAFNAFITRYHSLEQLSYLPAICDQLQHYVTKNDYNILQEKLGNSSLFLYATVQNQTIRFDETPPKAFAFKIKLCSTQLPESFSVLKEDLLYFEAQIESSAPSKYPPISVPLLKTR